MAKSEQFVEVESGATVFINPDAVRFVRPLSTSTTLIVLNDDQSICVDESYQIVANRLFGLSLSTAVSN